MSNFIQHPSILFIKNISITPLDSAVLRMLQRKSVTTEKWTITGWYCELSIILCNDQWCVYRDGTGSLFTDGALWKRGQNLEFIVDKMQEAIVKIEMWANKWGFRFSVSKTKIMLFTRKLGGRSS